MQTRAAQNGVTFLEQTAVVWKTALGSAIVWELARLTGSKHPYLAPLTFILCLQASVGQSLRYALYRSVGTVIGVVMIGLFAKSIPVTAWALAITLLLSTAVLKACRASDPLIHQVALSILFVLYFENHSSGYAWDRAKDTLIGAVAGAMFVVFLFPPNTLRKTEQTLRKFAQRFIDTVNVIADELEQGLLRSEDLQLQVNVLLDDTAQMTESLKTMRQGRLFNIYVSNREVDHVTQAWHQIRKACVHFVALIDSFTETMTEDERNVWRDRLRSLASEIPTLLSINGSIQ
ncbi:FUSC family protein [Alicyclobacillus acidiphilus]|uniref:FUSC family protein n=1 Tax=Alicyclobacillus acidiphilus TaxID=182455 RepID=UPI0008306DD6|nr:FUSC family protein [Alicyclobacillus acidiphilus]